MRDWFSDSDECGDEDDPSTQDPQVHEPGGRTISKVPFSEIVEVFPDANIVSHIRQQV